MQQKRKGDDSYTDCEGRNKTVFVHRRDDCLHEKSHRFYKHAHTHTPSRTNKWY